MAWEGLWGGSSLSSELNVEKEPVMQRGRKGESQREQQVQSPRGGNELGVLEEQKQAAVLEWRSRRKGGRSQDEVVPGAKSDKEMPGE